MIDERTVKKLFNLFVEKEDINFKNWGIEEPIASNYKTYYLESELHLVENQTTGSRCIIRARSPQQAVENVLSMGKSRISSHSEKDILRGCIELMNELYTATLEHCETFGEKLTRGTEEEGYPMFGMSYFRIVQRLFLNRTSHCGGTSTRLKCAELGVDDCEYVEFEPEVEE